MYRRSLLVLLRATSCLAVFPALGSSLASRVVITYAYRTPAGEGKVKLRLAFDTLGLDLSSSEQQVRNAYIALAKVYHPDTKNEKASPEKFAKVRKQLVNLLSRNS